MALQKVQFTTSAQRTQRVTIMGKQIDILRNEDGSVMLVALLLMAVLTIMGVAAINTSNIEILISSNDRSYKQNFYRSEAAAYEAAQIVEDADDANLMPATTTFIWLQGTGTDMETPGRWTAGNSQLSNIDTTNNTRYAVNMLGVAGGGSLDITMPSQLFEYAIYGLYLNPNTGRCLIAIGYRKRF